MKNCLFAGALFWGASLFAAPIVWDTDLIPLPPSASSGVDVNVNLSPGPNTEEAVAVWQDLTSSSP